MTVQEIIDYITTTPLNTNRAILNQMFKELLANYDPKEDVETPDIPEVIEKFTRAIQKGLDFVHNSTDEKVAEAILDFFPDTSLNDLTGVIERYRSVDTWPTTTEFSNESFYHLQEIMQAANELDETVKYEDLIYIRD